MNSSSNFILSFRMIFINCASWAAPPGLGEVFFSITGIAGFQENLIPFYKNLSFELQQIVNDLDL